MAKDQGSQSGDGREIRDAGLEVVVSVKCCGGENLYRISLQFTDRDIPGIRISVSCPVADSIKHFREFEKRGGLILFAVFFAVLKVGFDKGADPFDGFRSFLYDSGNHETLVAKLVAVGVL